MSRILARQTGKLRENVAVAWTCAPCPSCQSLTWNKRLCVTVRPRVFSSWSALTWYSHSQTRLSWDHPSLLKTRCVLPFKTCTQTRQGSLYGKHSDAGKRSIKSRRRKPSSRRVELKEKDLSSIIKPVEVKPSSSLDGVNIGEELTSPLKKDEVITVLSKFYRRPEVRRAAEENGIDDKLFHEAYVRFRRYCVESEALPVDLHVLFSDLLHDSGHVDDIFPYFLEHAKIIFPHLDCMEDLQQISDLRQPANWYPDARAIKRKLIFHAGPTNSGKTYHALENFMKAKSGVYCGPLRLLASEVYHKTNKAGTPCDLITGEERKYVDEEGESSPHSACTVEMVNVNVFFEVAVIDEIQMLRDPARGWAWTRALLGISAEEVHLCGEASAIELVKDLAMTTGDDFEVRNYERLTKLTVQDKAISSVKSVQAGDCIVCFNKNDIYKVSRQLEKLGYSVAVIYGTLPSGTKLSQARKFNDPEDPCKVMVATDAIGMGLNLSINRIIFYSLMKPFVNEKGEKEIDIIPPHMALQIAGRAGRYGTIFEQGQVTTFKDHDLPILQELLKTGVEPVEKAGLHPTAEQIELFAYHLPKATLSNLVDIFVTLSKVDSDRYFICNSEDFKFLADMIEHIPMLLRSRYVFCCAPISKNQPFACTMFLKYARQYSRGSPVSIEWLHREIGWPFEAPVVIEELVRLECIFDVLDNYLWLGYRFPDIFPNSDIVRELQTVLDQVIQTGVRNITTLLKNSQRVNAAQNPEEELAMSRLTLTDKERGKYPDRPPSGELDTLDDSEDESSGQTVKLAQNSGLLKHGRLSDKLIQQGILTSEMVEAIKKEMVNEESSDVDKETKV